MKHLKTYQESILEKNSSNIVYVEYEHGDADVLEKKEYYFGNKSSMNNFIKFLYELRNFIPNSGYEKIGYFKSSHNERNDIERALKLAKSYNINVDEFLEYDTRYGRDNSYLPGIENVYVKVNNKVKQIVYNNAINTNSIILPKIGEILESNVEEVPYLFDYFKDKKSKGLGHWDLEKMKIKNFKCEVLDIKIANYSKSYHGELVAFQYAILCKIEEGLITLQEYGYDKNHTIRNIQDYYFV